MKELAAPSTILYGKDEAEEEQEEEVMTEEMTERIVPQVQAVYRYKGKDIEVEKGEVCIDHLLSYHSCNILLYVLYWILLNPQGS